MKNKNLIIGGIVVLVLVVVGAFVVMGMNKNKSATGEMSTNRPAPTAVTEAASNSAAASGSASAKGAVKEFTVEGSSFKFVPKLLTVNQGDTVKIVFKNTGGMHDFVIDALGVKTSRVQPGASETVQFVADKVGTFEYYCSVANHKAMGMTGTLVVN